MRKRNTIIILLVILAIVGGVIINRVHMAAVDVQFEDEYLPASYKEFSPSGICTKCCQYKYNERHQLISETGKNYIKLYKYNDINLLESISEKEKSGMFGSIFAAETRRTVYEYDDNGNVVSETILENAVPYQRTCYTYGSDGRVISEKLFWFKTGTSTDNIQNDLKSLYEMKKYNYFPDHTEVTDVYYDVWDVWDSGDSVYYEYSFHFFDRYGTEICDLSFASKSDSIITGIDDLPHTYDESGNLIKIGYHILSGEYFEIKCDYDDRSRIVHTKETEYSGKSNMSSVEYIVSSEWIYPDDGGYVLTLENYNISEAATTPWYQELKAYNSDGELILEKGVYNDFSTQTLESYTYVYSKLEDIHVAYDDGFNIASVWRTQREYDDNNNMISSQEFLEGKLLRSEYYSYVLCK